MTQRAVRRILVILAFTLGSAGIALAQSATSLETVTIPIAASNSWQAALRAGSSKGKLSVVTLDQPNRRQSCRMQSYTPKELVCFRGSGGARTYLMQDVLALILPSNGRMKRAFVLGLNGVSAAAIWGTVVLATTCPACAVVTGIAAVWYLGLAGVTLICDNRPDHLLYVAPGQQLTGKLRFVRP